MAKFFSKKFIAATIVIVVVFSVFLPSSYANALDIVGGLQSAGGTILNWLGTGAKTVGASLFNPIAWLSLEGSQGMLRGSITLANEAIRNKMAEEYSYYNPAGAKANPIIATGWKLLRDFTNLFFILGLAYIGLATALNWASFGTKQALGKILLVALIINFSPIICGIFIDISNIIMNFFIRNANFDGLNSAYEALQGIITQRVWDVSGSTIFQTTALIITALFISIILLALSLYFLIRTMMIWLLVILSPLAFFSWIFKPTQGLYNFWQKQFYFWVISAIPVGFVVYLATFMAATLPSII